MGVSIEEQGLFYERIFNLISIPATVRFVSAEPLIGSLDLCLGLTDEIDWVIVGGESGNDTGKYRYRECELEWILDLVMECKEYNVPIFVKQLGTHLSKKFRLQDRHGGNIDEWPWPEIKVRQFPDN